MLAEGGFNNSEGLNRVVRTDQMTSREISSVTEGIKENDTKIYVDMCVSSAKGTDRLAVVRRCESCDLMTRVPPMEKHIAKCCLNLWTD